MTYARVYFSIIDDERFATIYGDDAALATWLRLLLQADAMYPAPAPIPRSTSDAALLVLVDAGVLVLVGTDHYRIRGMDAERQRRSKTGVAGGTARAASAVRVAGQFATSDAGNQHTSVPRPAPPASRAEPSRAEPNQAEHSAREFWEEGQDDETEALQYLARHQCHVGSPGNGIHRKLIELVNLHGITKVIATFDRIGRDRTLDARGYIFGAANVLSPIPTGKDESKAERAEEEQRRSDRETERTQRYLRSMRGEENGVA